MPPPLKLQIACNQVSDIFNLIYEKGYVASRDGNVMCRPTRCNKGLVKPGDLIVISTTGEKIRGERKQSSENGRLPGSPRLSQGKFI